MLSVVVIGRNGQDLLPGCLQSLREALSEADFETLYVDAHSVDASRGIAQEAGARVLIPQETRTTPALGRHIGAQAARGDVLLFLDHDMRLCPGFIETAMRTMQDTGCAGIVGEREDIFVQGGVETGRNPAVFGIHEVREAREFGGALLIRREALLRGGNYAPGVSTTEEMELYARLRKHHASVLEIPDKMILHIDQQRDNRSPLGVLFNRRRLGFGQAVAHATGAGSLWQLMRLHRDAWVLWALDVLGLCVALAAGPLGWLALCALQVPLLAWRVAKGQPRSYISDTLLLIYLPLGLLTYRGRDTGYAEDET